MARELHDLVAHRVGEIVIAAQAGQRADDRAVGALAAIEAAGREGLADLRRLQHLLDGDDERSVAPQPGLHRLARLAQLLADAGLRVEVVLTGTDDLPASLDLTAFRIVETVLADVLQAGTARTAQVRVRAAGRVLDLEICDDGQSRTDAPPGVRDRVALFGGSYSSGPVDGGNRVAARLLLDGVPA
jgi:signal transduction histidine kinase